MNSKNINKNKLFPFDLESFKVEILNQVNNRSDKLAFINITFGSNQKISTSMDIEFRLDEIGFLKIIDSMEIEQRHPIVTFHGTKNMKTVNSIFDNGYIIPGSNINFAIEKSHGANYGNGIYSSPFFDKAMAYTAQENKCVYILINFLLLGVAKLIPPTEIIENTNPDNGVYADKSNTRIVFGLDQIISADISRIIPIAVMKINIE